MRHLAILLIGCGVSAGCAASPDPTPTAAPTPRPWSSSVAPLDVQVRGLHETRAIVHLHSHWSHDACDGDPQPDGVPDEACLADLRRGLCDAGISVAFLSDHPTHADETDIATLRLLRDEDRAVTGRDGSPGNRMRCADGHEVLLLPGVEANDMMPLGLQTHVVGGYSGTTADDLERARAAGGLAWIAHTEQKPIPQLLAMRPDGIEIYQLHANLAPDLREEFLGLDGTAWLGEVGPFFFAETRQLEDPPEPDLAPLGFLAPNEPSLRAFEALGQVQRVGVSGGTDAHQNVLPIDAGDGERADSYRRMVRWFNTRLRADDLLDPDSVKDALRQGRSWVSFDVFGSATGFDLHAEAGDEVFELGSEIPVGAAVSFQVPTLDPSSPQGPDAPGVRGLLIWSDGQSREVLAEGAGTLTATADRAGVIRAEVWLTPRHLAPYLGEVADAYVEREVPWIWSGGLFVRE